jgi:NADH:ubiquinone oxidoreductase subunit 3 (subunit A)
VLIPIIKLGKKGITRSLIVLSIIIPYLYILSISVKEISILSIGTIMSLITIIYMVHIWNFQTIENKKD